MFNAFEIGDRVSVKVLKENRDGGYNPAPDGTLGTITDFQLIDYPWVNNYGHKPGMYYNHSYPHVKLDDGREMVIGYFHLEHTEPGLRERRLEAYRKLTEREQDALDAASRRGDLPVLPFWPHDKVEYIGNDDGFCKDNPFVVERICYHNIGQFCNDGVTPMPLYEIAPVNEQHYTVAMRESDLRLVERGNVYRYYNNEPVEFKDIEEEARFFIAIGHTKDVRNPASIGYGFTLDEALDAIRQGLGDAIRAKTYGDLDGVIKFNDRGLGRRVANRLLESFANRKG